jgi:type IV pilus assembly protein PilY1
MTCTAKNITNLGNIRGLCPEEPTKQGSFYSAAVAYYGKTMFKDNTGKPNVNTMAIALASPVPDINVKVGNYKVRVVPVGKSVSGCYSVRTN